MEIPLITIIIGSKHKMGVLFKTGMVYVAFCWWYSGTFNDKERYMQAPFSERVCVRTKQTIGMTFQLVPRFIVACADSIDRPF